MQKRPKTKYKNPKYLLMLTGLVFLVVVGILVPRGNVMAADAPYGQPTGCYSGLNGTYILQSQYNSQANCPSSMQWLTVSALTTAYGNCVTKNPSMTSDACYTLAQQSVNGSAPNPTQQANANAATAAPANNASAFQNYLSQNLCGFGLTDNSTFWPGCFIQGTYGLFYVIPAFLLYGSAYLFNYLISITLTSTLFAKATFIITAWTAVRDISNIFFILILLYLAGKTILGLNEHGVKKAIAMVIITALLINFSMFFTEVVIDASNILALVFYNKLQTTQTIVNGVTTTRQYTSVNGEKDVAGGLVAAFDPTKLLTPTFFGLATNVPANTIQGLGQQQGIAQQQNYVQVGIIIGITIVTGLIMLFATYALFIAGLSFVGRLIELWILIIFSPFALMSASTPLLDDIEYLGWKPWSKRLLTVAFMAPIFMFFMYFVFLLIGSNLFSTLFTGTSLSLIQTILSVVIPAMIIIIVLMKATEFAKKGSGALGNLVIKTAEIGMGVAAAAVTGGAAFAGQELIGKRAANLAQSTGFQNWAARSKMGERALKMTSAVAGYHFDAREGAVGGVLAAAGGISGLNLGHGSKFFRNAGGYAKKRADEVKANEEFVSKQLDTNDYGKAELSKGLMNDQRAAALERQMIRGGMSAQDAARHRMNLRGAGIQADEVNEVARHLDAAKREDYANREDNRTQGGVTFIRGGGTIRRGTARGSVVQRITANKVRRSAQTAQQQNQFQQAMAAIMQNPALLAQLLQNQPPQNPPPGAPPAAPPGPAPCWVAEVLYGINDQRTHAARLWATANDSWFTKLYRKYGECWAKWLSVHKWMQPIVKPIWNVMAIKGQTLALKIRTNKSSIDNGFDYLLEKVK